MVARVRLAFVMLLVALGVARQAHGQTPRPNVLLIVSDDLGYADIGVYGSKDIPTPNIDQIARSGVRFTDAYVTGPYCSPTRAGLMTGRYQQRFGHEFQPEASVRPDGAEIGLPIDQKTIANRLKAIGYRTALFGKWHLGRAEQFHPMRRGFDEFFGFLGGQHSYIAVSENGSDPLLDGLKPASSVTYLTDMLGDRAVEFIKRPAREPFLLYLAFNAGHTPMQAPEENLARFPNIANPQRRTYAAMVSAMDDAVGRVRRPVIQLDILPTALAAAGVSVRTPEVDGVNLLPFVKQTVTGVPHESLYWRFGGMMAIRRGDWKLVKTRDGPFVDVDPSVLVDLSEAGLYNLSEDIGETRNRAADRPEVFKELADIWQQWNRQLAKPAWAPPPGGRQGAGRSSNSLGGAALR